MSIEKPFFSIIVPVYNEELYICEALDSILGQTDSDWEALLIDDGSTDSTPEILNSYGRKDERFRVFHKPNGGTSTAINNGLQEARGEWVCWLSGDDYFHPQKLELHRRWIQNFPEALFFSTGYWLILPNSKKIGDSLEWLSLENPSYHLIQLLHSNWVMGISVCIKREVWLKAGELDGSLHYAQDLDMWVRLMLNTPNRFFPERTCIKRNHPGQGSARYTLESGFDAAKILIRLTNDLSFKELFPGVDLNNRDLARDMLSRAIDFVAGESDAYLYKLGVHPLLHLRILEWLWNPALDTTLRDELRLLLIERAKDFISLHSESPFGLIWQVVHAALKADRPQFAFFPCEPARIGEIYYYLQRAEQPETAQVLRAYLEKSEGLALEEASAMVQKAGQLLLILPLDISLDDPTDPEYIKIREIWQSLSQAGFYVVLVGNSTHTMGLVDGFLYVAAQTRHEQDQLLAELGDLDTAVALSHPERLNKLTAERRVYFDISLQNGMAPQVAVALLQKIQSTPRKKIHHLINAKRLHHLRSMYSFFVPISVRIRLRLGQRFRFLLTSLKNKKKYF